MVQVHPEHRWVIVVLGCRKSGILWGSEEAGGCLGTWSGRYNPSSALKKRQLLSPALVSAIIQESKELGGEN